MPFTGRYTSRGALPDVLEDVCGLDGLVYGVWFTFTPEVNSAVKLEISLPEFALEYGVMQRTQDNAAVCLHSFDVTSFFRTDVYSFEWNAVAGTEYDILVAGQGPGNNGEYSFTLKVRCAQVETRLISSVDLTAHFPH